MKNSKESVIQPHSFIGKQADDLGQLLYVQVKPIYELLGIIVPVKSCSIIHYLYSSKGESLVDLAKKLKQSHQLVKQKLPRLQSLNLIKIEQDSHDKRRKIYTLTALGKEQAALLKKHSLQSIYQDLSDEIAADLNTILSDAINSLQKKDLLSRFTNIKRGQS